MKWSAPASNGGALNDYDIVLATNSSFSGGREVDANPPATSVVLTGLTLGTQYWVRIRGENSSGEGAWSSAATYTNPDIPVQVPALSASPVGATGFSASWGVPGDGGSGITGYDVQYDDDPAFGSPQSTTSSTTSVSVSSLIAGATYWVRVRAVNKQGGGAWSTASRVLMGLAPQGPATISVTAAATGTSATVNITPPQSSPQADSYAVTYGVADATGAFIGTPKTQTFSTASPVVTGLTPGTRYSWTVLASNALGTAPVSNRVTLLQPHPSRNPGSFYDGSSDPTADMSGGR